MEMGDAGAMHADVGVLVGLILLDGARGKDGEVGAEHPARSARKVRALRGDVRDAKEASLHACSAERYGSGVRA